MLLIDEEKRSAILAPIEDASGIDGREDEGEAGTLLRELRSQRKSLVRLEISASMGDDAATPEDGWSWEDLAEGAQDYLIRFGKDLEPMAILIEAAVRIEGADGLAEAMALMADLVEAYWESGLYPAEDEDGVETRFMPISGLSGGGSDKDGALVAPLRRMELAQAGGDALRYLDKVRGDALMAAAQTCPPEQKAARAEEAETVLRQIDSLSSRLSRTKLQPALDAVLAAEAGWRRAVGYISERTKPRFPAASKVSGELQAIGAWLKSLLDRMPEEAGEQSAEADEGDQESGAEQAASSSAGGFVAGKISRREDALRAITAAASYFIAHEPLSPLGVALREVDRRARMSLDDLLAELIPDESARDNFYWRSGIKPPARDY